MLGSGESFGGCRALPRMSVSPGQPFLLLGSEWGGEHPEQHPACLGVTALGLF